MKVLSRRARPDTYTKLLLQPHGADASTVFHDFSQTAKVLTANGNVQVSTTAAYFNDVSIKFDGTTDYITSPDSTDFAFGTGDFTLEALGRFNTDTDAWRFFEQNVDEDNAWDVRKASGTDSGIFRLYFTSADIEKGHYYFTWDPVPDTWYHIEWVRSGTTAYIFINGVSQALTTNTAFGTNDVGNLAQSLCIGANIAAGAECLNGYFAYFRISKGIARHTSNFTPPTRRY